MKLAQDAPIIGNRNAQHSFSQIPSVNTTRSKFNRSFAVKDTFDFDELVPIFVDEILPGDTVNLNVRSFARLATQTKPVMDNMYIDYFFFFVPTRLVWDNWEKFNGAQDNPADSIDYTIPQLTVSAALSVGSIFDHMGLPTDVASNWTCNVLPFRAYNLIYNEWFRDQNLQDSITVNKDDGPDATTDYTLKKRAKKHDYFTSCLPWPQKGTAVDLPLGTSAPVTLVPATTNNNAMQVRLSGTDALSGSNGLNSAPGGSFLTGSTNATIDPNGRLEADLSSATAATLNDLRLAMMTQSLLELDARGGTRYVEIIRAHFNVTSPDFRLQRPEFLSAASSMISQHPIPQTSETGTTLQADLAAFSTAMTGGNRIGFSKSFTEHGYVIGLAQARADVTYQQGLNRMWSRETRYDFFWPKLQELGEQAVLNKEIYLQGDTVDTGSTGTPDDDRVFGYQERYAEYRYKPSEIRGQFRSTYSTSLDVWHLAEEFGSAPSLNSTFVESNTPIERNLAVTSSYPHILFDCWFNYIHARPMMSYGVPATLGRF